MIEPIKGISEETAQQIASVMASTVTRNEETFKAFDEHFEKLKIKAEKMALTIKKVEDGEPLDAEETQIYQEHRILLVKSKARQRIAKGREVKVQNVHHVKGFLYVCEHNHRFYWVNVGFHTNLADLNDYDEISIDLFCQLMIYGDKMPSRQVKDINEFFRPESIAFAVNMSDILLNDEEATELYNILNDADLK